MRQAVIRFVAAVAIVIVILAIGTFALTGTDWGREQVRKKIVAILQTMEEGHFYK